MKKECNRQKVVGLYQRVKVCIADILNALYDDLAKIDPLFAELKVAVRPANSLSDEGLRRGEDFNLITTLTGVLSDPALGQNCNRSRHPLYQIDIFGYSEAVTGEVGSIVSDSITKYARGRGLNLRVMDCNFSRFNPQTQTYQFSIVVQIYLKIN